MTLRELIEQLQQYSNPEVDIEFFAEISEDPQDCFILQFDEIMESSPGKIFVNLKFKE